MQLTYEDYFNLVLGKVDNNTSNRYFWRTSWKESNESYEDRYERSVYTNYCLKIINNYLAYIIGDNSKIYNEDDFDLKLFIREFIESLLICGNVWLLGLPEKIVYFDLRHQKENKKFIEFEKYDYKYFINFDLSQVEIYNKYNNEIITHGINPDLFTHLTINQEKKGIIEDVAKLAIEIYNLESVVSGHAFRSLDYYTYGPEIDSGEEPDKMGNKQHFGVGKDDQAPGILQIDTSQIETIDNLVSKKILKFASQVDLIEEFSIDVSKQETGVAKRIRKAAIKARVQYISDVIEDRLNLIQNERFNVFRAGVIKNMSTETLVQKEPNLVKIEPFVYEDVDVNAEILNLMDVSRFISNNIVYKEISQKIIGLLGFDDETAKKLIDEINKNVEISDDSNLVNISEDIIEV